MVVIILDRNYNNYLETKLYYNFNIFNFHLKEKNVAVFQFACSQTLQTKHRAVNTQAEILKEVFTQKFTLPC